MSSLDVLQKLWRDFRSRNRLGVHALGDLGGVLGEHRLLRGLQGAV